MAVPALSLEFRDGAFHKQASVSLEDRGFRYGLALFETLRISRGRALLVREHLAELSRCALETGWWNDGALLESALANAAGILGGEDGRLPEEGVARLHLTAGDGGFTEIAAGPRVFLTAQTRPAPDAALYETGIDVRLHPDATPNPAPGLKTQNYWPNLTALRQAAALGFREAILANEDGAVRGFCLGNLFMVKGSRILTPSLVSGCRRGIMRQWVIDRLDGAVEKVRISREDLQGADTIFLTNSGYGVLPIGRLDDRELPPSARVRGLCATFQELL